MRSGEIHGLLESRAFFSCSPVPACHLSGVRRPYLHKQLPVPPHLDLGIPSSANPGLTASRERSREPVELARQGNPCCGFLVLPYSPRRSRPPGLTWSFIQVAYPTVRLDRHHHLLSFVEIARDTVVQPEARPFPYPDPSTVSPHAASRTPQTGLADDLSRQSEHIVCEDSTGSYQDPCHWPTRYGILAFSTVSSFFLHTAAGFSMDRAGKCVIFCVALQTSDLALEREMDCVAPSS